MWSFFTPFSNQKSQVQDMKKVVWKPASTIITKEDQSAANLALHPSCRQWSWSQKFNMLFSRIPAWMWSMSGKDDCAHLTTLWMTVACLKWEASLLLSPPSYSWSSARWEKGVEMVSSNVWWHVCPKTKMWYQQAKWHDNYPLKLYRDSLGEGPEGCLRYWYIQVIEGCDIMHCQMSFPAITLLGKPLGRPGSGLASLDYALLCHSCHLPLSLHLSPCAT